MAKAKVWYMCTCGEAGKPSGGKVKVAAPKNSKTKCGCGLKLISHGKGKNSVS
jgi:hypothetical protein